MVAIKREIIKFVVGKCINYYKQSKKMAELCDILDLANDIYVVQFNSSWKNYETYPSPKFDLTVKRLKVDLDEESCLLVDKHINLHYKIWPFFYDYNKETSPINLEINCDLSMFEIPHERALDPLLFYKNLGIDFLPANIKQDLENSVFIDCGATWGDSALVLNQFSPKKIICFEPMRYFHADVQKLAELNGLTDVIKLAPFAIGDTETVGATDIDDGYLTLDQEFGDESNGNNSINITTIDVYCDENNIKPNLIKFDIEGYEYKGIVGAKNTICKNKPVLLISVYHTAKDFFEIKPYIESLELGYKFIIRTLNPHSEIGEAVLIAYVD